MENKSKERKWWMKAMKEKLQISLILIKATLWNGKSPPKNNLRDKLTLSSQILAQTLIYLSDLISQDIRTVNMVNNQSAICIVGCAVVSLRPRHIMWEKFEITALSQQLGLLSTLICPKNWAFRKCSSKWRNLKMELFKNDDITIIMWLPFPRFLKNKSKMPMVVVFRNFSSVVWVESI